MKKIFVFAMLIASIQLGYCQDLIIKLDKTEIKSKVAEITETLIKYKKWDNPDGPLYNISKSEVFMIVYANGQRETIKQAANTTTTTTSGSLQNNTTDKNQSDTKTLAEKINQPKAGGIDTSVNYKNIKLKYKPTRLNVGFQSPFTIGTDVEFRIVKNILNLGITYNYISEENTIASSFGFIYASFYAPINRLTGNYENQDKGLFIFGHAGYGMNYAKYLDFNDKEQTISSGGFTWRLGMDYYISKHFGITVSTIKFNSYYGGLVFSLF